MCDWKEYKLGDIYDFASGLSKSRDQFGFGYSFLSFKDVFNNYFVPKELTQLVNSTEKERERCSIKRGDAFLTRTSETQEELGMSSVALKDYPDATFNGFTKRLRPKNDIEILPEYAGFYFRSPRFRATVTSMASITTRASLNNGMLSELKVVIPPLPEQKAIASVLSSLDDKIDLLHRQNKTLEAMAETLFRQWFVEEAKEDWKIKISELPIKIIDGDRGKNYPKNSELLGTGDCLFLSAKNVTTNGFDFNQCQFITAEKDALLGSGKLKRNDIVITTRGTVGNIAYYNDLICYDDIRINSGMIILRTESSIIDPNFIYCLVRSNYFKCLIENQTSGSAQPQLPIRDFKQLDVYYPPKEKIDEFLVFAKSYLNKKFYNDSHIEKLEKLRDTLLPKLMSGEVRVEYNEN